MELNFDGLADRGFNNLESAREMFRFARKQLLADMAKAAKNPECPYAASALAQSREFFEVKKARLAAALEFSAAA